MRLFYSTDPNVLTDHCLGELNSYTKKDQMRRAFLIVPESMKADLERQYLEKHDHAGLMMAEVLSFSRLAHRLFSEAGGLAVRRISQAGKALLIQEILQSGSKLTTSIEQLDSAPENADKESSLADKGAYASGPADISSIHADKADSPQTGTGVTISFASKLASKADSQQTGTGVTDNPHQDSNESSLPGFKRFSRFVGRPGFAAELASVMGDFSRYGISSADLREASATAPTAITKDKLFDFSLLWEQYQKALSTHELIDPDQDLDRLISLLRQAAAEPRLSFLKDTAVWVLGFGETRAFTAQELSVLELLNKYCDSVTVTCSLDYLTADAAGQGENSASQAVSSITSDPIYSHGLDTALQIIKTAAGKLTVKRLEAEGKQALVTSIYAANPREELRYVCGEIREILVKTNLQRCDIGIALAEPDAYYDLLTATAKDYGLPVFIDRRTPLTQSSFLRYIDALLEYLLEKPANDTIMLYLRSGFDLLPRQTIDYFENFCLSKGLISPHDISRFNPQQQVTEGKISGREYSLWRQVQAVLEPLNDLGKNIRQKRLGWKKLDLLFDWVQSEQGPFKALADRIASLRKQDETEAALILADSWNLWLKLRDEAQTIIRSLLLSQADFTRLLRASLSGFSHSSIPVGIDSIRVGNLRQMSVYPVEVLFVVGTNQENFPPRSSEEGFLRDSERSWLEEHSQKKFPNRKQDLPLAREWQMQQLLASPRRHLYISAPSLNKEETSLVQKQLEDRGGTKTIVLSSPFSPSAAWHSKKTAQMQLNLALSDPVARNNLETGWLILLEALLMTDKEADVGLNSEFQTEMLSVSAEQVKQLVLPRNVISVSQLQKYNRCPYTYFASYLLRLHERETWEPSAREQGSLMHAMMEIAVSELITHLQTAADDKEKTAITADWFRFLDSDKLDNYFETAISMTGFNHFDVPEILGQTKQRIIRYAHTSLQLTEEQVIRDQLFPSAVEWRFPLPDQDNFSLRADEWQATLKGTIDRIDTGGGSFMLIDYKRGSRKVSYADIAAGTNLQLPLYLKVYRHLYPQAVPQGFGYFTFKDQRSDNRKGISPATDNKDLLKDAFDKQKCEESPERLAVISDYSAARANSTMQAILKGDISARPTVIREKQSPCSYCLLKAHCLYDRRTRRDRVQTEMKEKELEQNAFAQIMKCQIEQEAH